MEVTVDELCKGYPEEFREFMNYCRKLQFTEDPDYKYMIGLFEGCMKKNGYDPKVPDFIWNKNRLFLEKEQLKQNMIKVIGKPAKKPEDEEAGEEQKKEPARKIDKGSVAINQANAILQKRKEDPSKAGVAEVKPVGSAAATGSKQQQYGDAGVGNQQAPLYHPNGGDQSNATNARGSDFK